MKDFFQRTKFLTAEWRYLAMLNYAVEPALLEPYVPPGTWLDLNAGKAYVSLVGFRFLNTRVVGVRFPFHTNFDEVNLRFYVKRLDGDLISTGVVFVREIVPRRAVAAIARLFYNEPYVALPMRHRIEMQGQSISTQYEWRSEGRWNRLFAEASGPPAAWTRGSQEQFITERSWGFTAQRRGAAKGYLVTHPSWRIWQAGSAGFEGDATALYGAQFAKLLQRPPDSALIAEGSAVTVYRGRRVDS